MELRLGLLYCDIVFLMSVVANNYHILLIILISSARAWCLATCPIYSDTFLILQTHNHFINPIILILIGE